MSGPLTRYAARLARAAKTAVPALVEETGLDRAAASAAFATACALTLAGLARHQRRRPDDRAAARAVVEKYGRPADLDAAALAVRAHLADPRLDARLGGLLGDAGPRAVAWLAARTKAPSEALSRALAASVPLALGALHAAAEADQLPNMLAEVSDGALADPACLLDRATPVGRAFRRVRRAGLPLLSRGRAL